MAYKKLKTLLKNSYCIEVCYTTPIRVLKVVEVSQLTKEELDTAYNEREWMIKDKTLYIKKGELMDKEVILHNVNIICERCNHVKHFNGRACQFRKENRYCLEMKTILAELKKEELK